jgi:hypothetical protein
MCSQLNKAVLELDKKQILAFEPLLDLLEKSQRTEQEEIHD